MNKGDLCDAPGAVALFGRWGTQRGGCLIWKVGPAGWLPYLEGGASGVVA